jgi:lysophospholipase L1-like esterase
MAFTRFVALGDSTTEGIGDEPWPDGRDRGWADRLAHELADLDPSTRYANLAVRGMSAIDVRDDQLAAAVALEPDLATVIAGMNDLVSPRFDAAAVGDALEDLVGTLRSSGATVVTMTFPDLGAIIPFGRLLAGRVEALNTRIRAVADTYGAELVDAAQHPVAGDPRIWADDRLHLNPDGHVRIAGAVARAIDLPGSSDDWLVIPPAGERPGLADRVGTEVRWARTHLAPWVGRRVTGRSSGDGRVAKRPTLAPVAVR